MEPDGKPTPDYVLSEDDLDDKEWIECPDCGTQNIHFDRWLDRDKGDEPDGRAFTCDDCGCTFWVMRDEEQS
jgi:DNA-directed RNA polymerase subunit M/transcription elongation factor TFIIS